MRAPRLTGDRAATRLPFRNFGSGLGSIANDPKPGIFGETTPHLAYDLLNPQPNTVDAASATRATARRSRLQDCAGLRGCVVPVNVP